MTKAEQAEQTEAQDQLRAILKPGDEVRTILRHVSRSGMSRSISVIVSNGDGVRDISWLIARAGLGRFDRKYDGIKVGGCGMDMGFSLVYNLSRALYGDSFVCVGEGCPSNDHSNGDLDRTPHKHSDGGYALTQRWL